MSLLGEETVTVQHYRSVDVSGRPERTADGDPFTLTASVQPIEAMVDELPELARSAASWIMIVEGSPDLRITKQGTDQSSDRVTRVGGELYTVDKLFDWSSHITGIPHRVATLIEVGGDELQG